MRFLKYEPKHPLSLSPRFFACVVIFRRTESRFDVAKREKRRPACKAGKPFVLGANKRRLCGTSTAKMSEVRDAPWKKETSRACRDINGKNAEAARQGFSVFVSSSRVAKLSRPLVGSSHWLGEEGI
ncbi:hypothetical protein MTO96_027258 [Rhipicephalus appendiculatus]